MTDKAEDVIESLQVSMDGGFFTMRQNLIRTAMALIASQAAEIERITDVWHALHKENIRLAGINAALEDALKRLGGAPMRLNAETHHD